MPLEQAVTIDQLVEAWPLNGDKRRQGAGHLRGIKKALKGTFPNVTGQVTKTHAQLNALPNDFAAYQAEIVKHLVPMRTIMMWSGAADAVPAGYALCNGQTITGFGTTPDLRDTFIIGAGGSLATGATGGNNSAVTSASGGHSHDVTGTVLSTSQMPTHSHQLFVCNGDTASADAEGFQRVGQNIAIVGARANPKQYASQNGAAQALMTTAGSNEPHDHGTVAVDHHTHTVDTRPAFYALAFIIKTTSFIMP